MDINCKLYSLEDAEILVDLLPKMIDYDDTKQAYMSTKKRQEEADRRYSSACRQYCDSKKKAKKTIILSSIKLTVVTAVFLFIEISVLNHAEELPADTLFGCLRNMVLMIDSFNALNMTAFEMSLFFWPWAIWSFFFVIRRVSKIGALLRDAKEHDEIMNSIPRDALYPTPSLRDLYNDYSQANAKLSQAFQKNNIPAAYRNDNIFPAVAFILEGRANSFNEAYNLTDLYLHRAKMEAMQAECVDNSKTAAISFRHAEQNMNQVMKECVAQSKKISDLEMQLSNQSVDIVNVSSQVAGLY